jgi:hypothetical protein
MMARESHPISDGIRAELRRRSEALDRDPAAVIPAETVMEELERELELNDRPAGGDTNPSTRRASSDDKPTES